MAKIIFLHIMFVFPHPSQLSMAYSSLPSVTGVVDKPQDVAGVNHSEFCEFLKKILK